MATEYEIEDVTPDWEERQSGEGGEREVWPTNYYYAALVGFKTVEKPDWKYQKEVNTEEQDAAAKDRTPRQVDRQQFQWTWRVVQGEYEGQEISDWTSRSWFLGGGGFSPSKSASIIAALDGKGKPDESIRDAPVSARGGKVAKLNVIEKNGKNYVKDVMPDDRKPPRGKTQKAAEPRENLLARKAAALRARKEDGWTNAELQDEYHKHWKDTAFADLPQEEQIAVCEYFENLGPATEIEF